MRSIILAVVLAATIHTRAAEVPESTALLNKIEASFNKRKDALLKQWEMKREEKESYELSLAGVPHPLNSGEMFVPDPTKIFNVSEARYWFTTPNVTNNFVIIVTPSEARAQELFEVKRNTMQLGPHDVKDLGDEAFMSCVDPAGKAYGTLLVRSGRVVFGSGAGIVADSIEFAKVFLESIKESSDTP